MSGLKVGSIYCIDDDNVMRLSWDEVGPESVGGVWPKGGIVLLLKDNVRVSGNISSADGELLAYLGLLLKENCRIYIYKTKINPPLKELEAHD